MTNCSDLDAAELRTALTVLRYAGRRRGLYLTHPGGSRIRLPLDELIWAAIGPYFHASRGPVHDRLELVGALSELADRIGEIRGADGTTVPLLRDEPQWRCPQGLDPRGALLRVVAQWVLDRGERDPQLHRLLTHRPFSDRHGRHRHHDGPTPWERLHDVTAPEKERTA